jgi:hypothetical protein
MQKISDQSVLTRLLDWLYDRAIKGVPGFDSAVEMSEEYAAGTGSLADRADSLIRWQVAKAGTSGFLSGLGGVLTLPVAVPANITSVMYVQLRMIAAIAHLGGHDVKSDRVRTLAYACLCGNAAKDVLKEVGVSMGTKLTTAAIERLSFETIKAINRAVGFRLVTKFGETGVINLGRAVPIVGGIIGGSFDSVTTNTVGNIARDTFIH